MKARYIALALLILLGTYGFRLWHISTESIWHDEAWSIRAIRGPFTTPDDNTPFVYYLSGHMLWQAGGGESPLALRYVSVLFGLVTVALGLRIGRRWFGPGGGLLAGLLLALSPLLWEYSQEVRAYVVVPLIALGLLAGADAILRGWTWRRAGFLFMVQLIGLYSHNLSVPLVVWLNLALGVAWLYRREWRSMIRWAGLEIGLIAAYIPWLLTQSPSGTPLNTPPTANLDLLRDIWAAYLFPVNQQVQDAVNRLDGFDVLTPYLLVGGLVGLSAIVWAVRPRDGTDRRRAGLLISHALAVPAFSTALMIAANIDFHPRYYIAALPGTLLMIVGTVYAVPPSRWPRRVTIIAVLTLALVGTAISLFQIRTRSNYQHDDFRGLAQYYATLDADAVILVPFDAERALQDYYADRFDIASQFVNVPLYSDPATAIETINALIPADGSRHVELLTWYQLPADARGMYPCLLRAASRRVDDLRFYVGLGTQAYHLTEPLDFTPLADSAQFRGIDYLGGATASGPAGTCLHTRWMLPAPTNDDYATASALLNPFDDPVARTDAPIARDDNAPTSRWTAGDEGDSFALLELPPNAPDQRYTATLGVYNNAQPSGLDVLDAGGNPAGKSARFETAVRATGEQVHFYDQTTLLETRPRGQLTSGETLDVTLYAVPDAAGTVELRLIGSDWDVARTLTITEAGSLAWEQFTVPPSAVTGTASLRADGVQLADFDVIAVERVYDPPDFGTPLAVRWPGIGTLAGVTLPETLTSGESFSAELVWQAEQQADLTAYTVFVQVVSPAGVVLAQSDAIPPRPTTAWVADEYIVHAHDLTWNVPDYDGPAQIIAGFYDPADFRRALTASGEDFAIITENIGVMN
jgi:hypothetical protein